MVRPKNNFELPINLVVSVSGGETSMYMAWWLKNHAPRRYKLHFIFANTGEEHLKTLDFINECDKAWNLGVIWLEAIPQKGRKGTQYKEVTYETAAISGEPFEAVIKKYGIPNMSFPHCNRELKLAPIQAFMKKNHLNSAWVAIGIRYDELDRQRAAATDLRLVYPFIEWAKITKNDVKQFWRDQDIQLGLAEHEGNCMWCWKKSDRKLYTLALENPEVFDFPLDMERMYPISQRNKTGENETFFRKGRSTKDILREAKEKDFVKFTDPYQHDNDMDTHAGCEDRCEPFLIDE